MRLMQRNGRTSSFYRLSWLMIGLLCAGAAIAGLGRLQGYQMLSVQSDSMQPAIRPGDVVIVHDTSLPVGPGMIVSYHSLRNPQVINTHRIISINRAKHTLTTRGDNVLTPETGIPEQNIVGAVAFSIPYGGRLLDILKHPLGLVLTIYLPVLGILLEEVKSLTRYYGTYYPRRYSLYR